MSGSSYCSVRLVLTVVRQSTILPATISAGPSSTALPTQLCLLNQEKVEKSERYFDSHGMVATITGRLIPGIRHLISIPAGLAKMNYWRFLLYTTIGAGVWNCILAALGWWMYSFVPENQLEAKIMEYGDYIKFAILGLVAVVIVWFVASYAFKKVRKKNQA